MSVFYSGNVKMALASIRSTRWRSFMTIFGIVIGIVSVVTAASLSEGVRQQVAAQVNRSGKDVITIRPGKLANQGPGGSIQNVNLFNAFSSGSFSDNDVRTVKDTPHIKTVVPLGLVNGQVNLDNRQFKNGLIVATTEDLPLMFNQKVEFGEFFKAVDDNKNVAVIGRQVAEQLFQENVPTGQTFKIRGQDFVVRGIFEQLDTNPLAPNSDFNSAIFIPYSTAKQLVGGNIQTYQLLARPSNHNQLQSAVTQVRQSLLNAHGGQEDFTVLTANENLALTNRLLNLLTGLTVGIAAISLVVAGIGILNIMLVAVTERTHEIGIRKSIGATNRQLLNQFLVEAIILSVSGGIGGVIFAALANILLRIFTNLHPVITLQLVVVATIVTLVLGVVAGLAPAVLAARRDPIDALRQG